MDGLSRLLACICRGPILCGTLLLSEVTVSKIRSFVEDALCFVQNN